MNPSHTLIKSLLASAVLIGLCPTAFGQLPATRLDGLFPAGGSPGQTLDVTIFGGDLDDVNKLHFSHAGITAEQKMADPGPFDEGKQIVENQFIVTIKPDVPPGHYSVRCQGKYGLSGPRTFVVDAFTEVLETEPNHEPKEATEIAAVPASVNGQLNGGADVDWFKIQGQANQRLLVECYVRADRFPGGCRVASQIRRWPSPLRIAWLTRGRSCSGCDFARRGILSPGHP